MKKMLLATALALLITGCAQQTFTVQNKPAAVTPKETI
ncbi:serum resistance lipoprotein Bor, partial [Escherichia coli]